MLFKLSDNNKLFLNFTKFIIFKNNYNITCTNIYATYMHKFKKQPKKTTTEIETAILANQIYLCVLT